MFSESAENLERKYPPEELNNLDEEIDDYTYGVKVKFEMEHYFSGNTIWDVYDYDEKKYDFLTKTISLYESQILVEPMEGVAHAYMHLKGFDTLIYTSLYPYESQFKNQIKTIDKNLLNPEYNKEHLLRKKEQLQKFNKEKEYHFKNMGKVTCLIALESLSELGWMWSDSGFKYLYILDEDLEKRNFENVLLETWSS